MFLIQSLPAYSNEQLSEGIPGSAGFQFILLEGTAAFSDALYITHRLPEFALSCSRTATPHLIWREGQVSSRCRTLR